MQSYNPFRGLHHKNGVKKLISGFGGLLPCDCAHQKEPGPFGENKGGLGMGKAFELDLKKRQTVLTK